MVGGNTNNSTFAKTICSICYEDLKPIVEDLQSISICGHVFHELCLQQWFDYCTNGKKRNCPVCKQTCSATNVSRLYFQSIGDPNDGSLSQKLLDYEENPCELRKEVKRLEGKVLGLSSALEQRHKDLEAVNKELHICKEKFEAEAKQKYEALKEKATIQQLLHMKSEDLDKSTLECMRLQERNMALAKELAALKLVSDLNLDEDDVLKLASLGNEANSRETIDILKKSLVTRNKSYKELMAKCNTLGRGEARSHCKLEKAKEKIRKLKVRIQELESAIEAMDNEVLRNLKASKSTAGDLNLPNSFRKDPKLNKCLAEDQKIFSAAPNMDMNQVNVTLQNSSSSVIKEKTKPLMDTNHRTTTEVMIASNLDPNNQEKDVIVLDEDEDEDVSKTSSFLKEISHRCQKPAMETELVVQKCNLSRPGVALDAKSDIQLRSREQVSGPVNANSSMDNASPAIVDDLMLPLDNIMPVQPLFSIRKETSSFAPVSQPGESCFSGALRGPDGTNWHLGKWCRKAHIKGSTASSVGSQGSSAGDLIAVGADGRGGRIKALRSLNLSSSDNKDGTTWPKRCKYGAKASSLQSQIHNFFGRTGQ